MYDAVAKIILTASPSENWKRPPGAYNLTLKEAVNLAQYVEAVYIWHYTLLVVHARKQDCGRETGPIDPIQ